MRERASINELFEDVEGWPWPDAPWQIIAWSDDTDYWNEPSAELAWHDLMAKAVAIFKNGDLAQ